MQRFSKKRQAILDCLKSADNHPTAELLYAQLKPVYSDLSLATVYRNLTQLKEAGLIRSLGTVLGQERFEPNLVPHTHAICSCCGKITDIADILLPPEHLARLEVASEYVLSDARLSIFGVCPECRAKQQKTP